LTKPRLTHISEVTHPTHHVDLDFEHAIEFQKEGEKAELIFSFFLI
jgi:hypothetical protein